MKKTVELPLVEPLYSTYHFQGSHAAIIADNPSIRNFFFNKLINLMCNRKFLYGYTSPELSVVGSSYSQNPHIETKVIPTEYIGAATNSVIKNLLDDGWYVVITGIDDYYIKGKSWYHEVHVNHDGLIVGYDDNKRTFSFYAYDQTWVYRKFETPQYCVEKARSEGAKKGSGELWACKPKSEQVKLEPKTICDGIKEYIGSSFNMYRPIINANAYGIVVQDYLVMYIDRLSAGIITHNRMDTRIFRLIWEHKKVMLERIRAVENELALDKLSGYKYEPLVKLADDMRMLYAAYHKTGRVSLLQGIREKLINLREREFEVLNEFVIKIEEAMKK